MGIQQELVQPARLHLLPLPHQRRREPAPGIVRLDVGIDRFFVGDDDREQQPGQIASLSSVVVARFQGILGNHQIGPAHAAWHSVHKHVLPEHERTVGSRLSVTLLNRHAILVDQLGSASFTIQHRHPHQCCVAASLAVNHQRLVDLPRGEMRREERIVCRHLPFPHRFWPVAEIPAIHSQRVATTAVVLLRYLEARQTRFLTGRGVVDKLRSGWLSNQSQHKCHHSFPLLVVERELRHAVPLVVAFVLSLLVVVAAGSTELLPEESLPLMRHQLFEEIAGVRVDRLRTQVRRAGAEIGQIGCQRSILGGSMIASVMGTCVMGTCCGGMVGSPVALHSMVIPMGSTMLPLQIVHHELENLLEGDLG